MLPVVADAGSRYNRRWCWHQWRGYQPRALGKTRGLVQRRGSRCRRHRSEQWQWMRRRALLLLLLLWRLRLHLLQFQMRLPLAVSLHSVAAAMVRSLTRADATQTKHARTHSLTSAMRRETRAKSRKTSDKNHAEYGERRRRRPFLVLCFVRASLSRLSLVSVGAFVERLSAFLVSLNEISRVATKYLVSLSLARNVRPRFEAARGRRARAARPADAHQAAVWFVSRDADDGGGGMLASLTRTGGGVEADLARTLMQASAVLARAVDDNVDVNEAGACGPM